MQIRIAHTLVVDTCARIIAASPQICDLFRRVLAQQLEVAHMGAARQVPVADLLTQLRDGWSAPPPKSGGFLNPEVEVIWRSTMRERTLAYLLGCLCYRGALAAIETLPDDARERGIYQDAHLLRALYGTGSAPSAPGGTARDVEEFVELLLHRCLMAYHTILPGRDFLEWMQRLIRLRTQFMEQITRYATVLAAPAPAKTRVHVIEAKFFDAGDDLIEIAQRMMKGRFAHWTALEQALGRAPTQNAYARAVARAYANVEAASRFWTGKLSAEALRDAVEAP